jgi:hypothetical protein
LFENNYEIAEAVKSDIHSYFIYFFIAIFKQLGSLADPVIVKITDGGIFHHLLEKPAKLAIAHVYKF